MLHIALASTPILESMCFVNLAINWAIACGVKKSNVYQHLKKFYYRHHKASFGITINVKNGWNICEVIGTSFIGRKYSHVVNTNYTLVYVYTRNELVQYDNYLQQKAHKLRKCPETGHWIDVGSNPIRTGNYFYH